MDYGISSQQLAVICALSDGASVSAAAEQAGVHRNTINNWRRNSPYFQKALADAQYDRALLFRERAEALAELAFQAIHEILTNPKTPPSVRLRAALAIMQAAVTPPEQKKQVELEIQEIAVAASQTGTGGRTATAPPATAAVHKNAQPGAVNSGNPNRHSAHTPPNPAQECTTGGFHPN